MPLPLIPIAGGAAIGWFMAEIWNAPPLQRGKQQIANALYPNQVPGMSTLLHLYVHSYINRGDLDHVANFNGVDLTGVKLGNPNSSVAKSWQAVVEDAKIKPPGDAVFAAWIHGRFPFDSKEWVFNHYKHSMEHYAAMVDMYRQYPTTQEVITLYNRQAIDINECNRLLQKFGGYTDQVKEYYRELGTLIPGPSDLIRFSVREAFNPGQVALLELDAEIDENSTAEKWIARQGLGESVLYEGGVPVDRENWFEKYWYAHWQLPSPTQIHEFYHRLRPDRMQRYVGAVPGVTPFTFDTMNAYLKANDYTPPVRRWLAAVNFKTPRLIDQRNMYYADVITRQEFIEFQRDLGYTPEDAEAVAKLADIEKKRWQYRRRTNLLDKYDTAWVGQIVESFRVGAIGVEQFERDMIWAIGSPEAANAQIQAEKMRKNNKVIREYIGMVRSGFFTGEMSAESALQILMDGGVNPIHADQQVTLWEARMTLPRRVIAARKLVEWYVMQLIDAQNLIDRMTRLGYSPQSTAITLAEAETKRRIAIAKAEAEEQRRQKQLLREERQRQKEAMANIRQGARDRNMFRTPTKIAAWVREGKMSREIAEFILNDMLVPATDIPRWLGEESGNE